MTEPSATPARDALAAELKRLSDSSARSLRDLARAVHSSPATLSRVVNWKMAPSAAFAVAIARELGGDAEHVEQLWEAADAERRPGGRELGEIDLEGDERELLRTVQLDGSRRPLLEPPVCS